MLRALSAFEKLCHGILTVSVYKTLVNITYVIISYKEIVCQENAKKSKRYRKGTEGKKDSKKQREMTYEQNKVIFLQLIVSYV